MKTLINSKLSLRASHTLLLVTLLLLIPLIQPTEGNSPIAFPDVKIDGKKYAFVIVQPEGSSLKYTLNGVTETKPFSELHPDLKTLVQHLFTNPNPIEETPSELETESEDKKPRLNREQIAVIAQRELQSIIRETITHPESYSPGSSSHFVVNGETYLKHQFRAIGPNGKKRAYTIEAKINPDGEILYLDWKNQQI